ncbi:MAG: SpoIID/LytB domain-containing protein [Bacteroidota bacterium]
MLRARRPGSILRLLTVALAVVASAPASASSLYGASDATLDDDLVIAESVRVRVLERERASEVMLTGDAGLTLIDRDGGTPVATLQPGTRVTLKSEYGRVYVYLPRRVVSVLGLRAEPGPGGTVAISAGQTTRRYEGSLAIDDDRGRLRLVNTVPLEAYVASVTAGEYPFQEIEGVKAQAVLARTYALRSRGKRGAYDLVDHTADQVYHGADRTTEITRAAAVATAGQVLVYNGRFAETVYSSSNGGYISANETAWRGAPVPYLRARPDPYDRNSPHERWQTTKPAGEVHRALGRAAGFSVRSFEITRRSAEGRVTEVRLSGSRNAPMSGSAFRAAMSRAFGIMAVRSTYFEVERRGGSYVFSGQGFGHGVGMSQYGARGQAQAGRRYEDILAFYFEGTRLTETRPSFGLERPLLTGVDADADALRAAVESAEAPAVDTEAHASEGPRGWADDLDEPTALLPFESRPDRRIAW